MKTLWIGMVAVVLLALVALPAMADPVPSASASAPVNLTIEKYVEITNWEQAPWMKPTVVSNGATQATVQMSFKINGNVDYCWYWWGIDLDPEVCPSRWYVWGDTVQGAYPDTTDLDSDGDTDEYLQFNDGAQGCFPNEWYSGGYVTFLIIKGITLEDDANDYTDTLIGTATMTLIGDGSPCPHPGA